MNPEITAALNKIQQVLNHYKAFKDIEAALQVAGEADRLVVEYGLQADALKKEIAGLETAKADMGRDIAEAGRVAGEAHVAAIAKADAAEKAAWDDVKVVEARLEGLRLKVEEMEKVATERAQIIQNRIDELEVAAAAGQKRLNKIKAKIDELKGL